jgi:hypothetical protein
MSQDDKKFLLKMEQGVRQREDGHYEMPLPFRKESPVMPNNKSIALHRLTKFRTRMETNKRYLDDYITFMNELNERNYAERIPENELANEDGNVWYIPHHGVYHPRKPEKIRVVFDCSVNYKGESLNDHLLQGPDLTNQLVGVLFRFRKDSTAFMCDVEAMFHQFKVVEVHRNFLRFLWWEDGDTSKRPIEYRMTVHLFGAGSSPGCANFETSPEQWRHVKSKENPADEASRGLTAREFLDSERWLSGPSFLQNPQLDPVDAVEHPLSQDDPEVKRTVLATQTSIDNFLTIPERLEYFSEWHRAKRAIAAIMRWQQRTKSIHQDDKNSSKTNVPQYRRSNVEELRQAELAIVRAVQEISFSKEIQLLRNMKENSSNDRDRIRQRKTVMKQTCSLFRLNPFLDKEGILKVGGRLTRASVPFHVKHPVILPRKGHVTALVIKHYHQRIRHQGRGMTLNELRAKVSG